MNYFVNNNGWVFLFIVLTFFNLNISVAYSDDPLLIRKEEVKIGKYLDRVEKLSIPDLIKWTGISGRRKERKRKYLKRIRDNLKQIYKDQTEHSYQILNASTGKFEFPDNDIRRAKIVREDHVKLYQEQRRRKRKEREERGRKKKEQRSEILRNIRNPPRALKTTGVISDLERENLNHRKELYRKEQRLLGRTVLSEGTKSTYRTDQKKKGCARLFNLDLETQNKIIPEALNICRVLAEDTIDHPSPSRLCIIRKGLLQEPLAIGKPQESVEFYKTMNMRDNIFSGQAVGFLKKKINEQLLQLPPAPVLKVKKKTFPLERTFKKIIRSVSKRFKRKKRCLERSLSPVIYKFTTDMQDVIKDINLNDLIKQINLKEMVKLFPNSSGHHPYTVLKALLEVLYQNPYRVLLLDDDQREFLSPIINVMLGDKGKCESRD